MLTANGAAVAMVARMQQESPDLQRSDPGSPGNGVTSSNASPCPSTPTTEGGGSSGGGKMWLLRRMVVSLPRRRDRAKQSATVTQPSHQTTYAFCRHAAIRSTYADKSIEAKKKVIRMLFVVVLEFFVCWTPLHVLNTWYLFHPEAVYKAVGSTGVSLVQLLAYISSCCNPITYCFMNKKFRQAFIGAFDCFKHKSSLLLTNRGSELSANDSALYAGRASTVAKSREYKIAHIITIYSYLCSK